MILVAGLSPAWQQIAQLERLQLGGVNRAQAVHWCASGKVLNVGLALQRLLQSTDGAADVQVVSVAGGPAGEELRAGCARHRLPVEWIATRAPTRVCTTLLDAESGRTTEMVENARPIEPTELAAFEQAFVHWARYASVVVLAGSFPAGTPVDFYARLMRQTRATIIVDAQGPPLLACLAERPAVIKPNREEFARTMGTSIDTADQFGGALADCHARGAQGIVITGGAGPVVVSTPGRIQELQPPAVPVVNPIGSGDCLAAGLAWGLARGWSLVDSTRWGVAAAADNVAQLLPADIDRVRVGQLWNQVTCLSHPSASTATASNA